MERTAMRKEYKGTISKRLFEKQEHWKEDRINKMIKIITYTNMSKKNLTIYIDI